MKSYEKNNEKKQTVMKAEEFFEDDKKDELFIIEQVNAEKETSIVKAIITNETQKALLLQYNEGDEVWTPKSIIHSQYESKEKIRQSFTIESWFLQKNNIIR